LGCKPLTGDRVRLTANVPITANSAFNVTEIARIYVPPSSEPLAIEADISVAATNAGTTSTMLVVICPASALNVLGAVGARGVPTFPATGDWGHGALCKFTAWPAPGSTWPAGDYVLAAQR